MEPDSKAGRVIIGIAIVVILLLLAPYFGISLLEKNDSPKARNPKPASANSDSDELRIAESEDHPQESRKDTDSTSRKKSGRGPPSDSSAVLDDIEELLRDGKNQ